MHELCQRHTNSFVLTYVSGEDVAATNLEKYYCGNLSAGFCYQMMSDTTSTMTIPIQLEQSNVDC